MDAGASLVLTSEASATSIEEPEKVLGKLELAPRCASGIVLLAPPQKDGEAEAHLITDAFASFPAGSIKVDNLAPDPVRIELEGKEFECAAGAELRIQDPPVGERYASGMRACRKQGDEWVQVMAGVGPHLGKKRVLQIITINPDIQRIEIKGVRDISSPPAPVSDQCLSRARQALIWMDPPLPVDRGALFRPICADPRSSAVGSSRFLARCSLKQGPWLGRIAPREGTSWQEFLIPPGET